MSIAKVFKKLSSKKIIISLVMAFVIFFTSMVFAIRVFAVKEDPGVTFHFINVNSITREDTGGPIGSADCVLIDDHGIITLCDTGTKFKNSVNHVVDYMKSLGITKIDNLVISHPHSDHIGGIKVIDEFDVKNAFYLPIRDWSKVRPCEIDWGTKKFYDRGIRAIKEKINSDGTSVKEIISTEEGQVYKISKDSDITVYNSLAVNVNNYREPEFNDFSLIIKYRYKNVNALINGDINIQYYYVMTGEVKKDGTRCVKGDPEAIDPVGPIQIFKFPHHGTEGSNAPECLYEVMNPTKDPSYLAVCTGHKANVGPSVYARAEKYGYQHKITHDGDIVIHTDGKTQEWAN